MLFPSIIFIVFFLPISIIVYYLVPSKMRNLVLLFSSLFFYSFGEPDNFYLILLSIFINYLLGLLVDKYRIDKFKSKLVIILCVILNIGLLAIYKYLDFVLVNINYLFSLKISLRNIPLPIGISFFTFQAMSYVIDVYRNNGKVQKNIFNVALYISFFPQLIAGPIVRYQTVAEQINDSKRENIEKFSYGVTRFVHGLAKKVILADSFALIADHVFSLNGASLSSSLAWLGIISYTLQIYLDFSGYSDMAIGLGQMFGFEFLENFNYPYISRSVTEFWRRWHISLGSWFRDYLYIPLGGNRVSKTKLMINLFIVWVLTGLWHGASWNFIFWGVWFWCFIAIEKRFDFEKREVNGFLKYFYTIFVVVIGWVFFRSDTLIEASEYIVTMFSFQGSSVNNGRDLLVYYLSQYRYHFLIGFLVSTPILRLLSRYVITKIELNKLNLLYYVINLILFVYCLMTIVSSSYKSFIYFRF